VLLMVPARAGVSVNSYSLSPMPCLRWIESSVYSHEMLRVALEFISSATIKPYRPEQR
jgi:hypothetical protein